MHTISLTGTDLKRIESLTERLQACLDTTEDGTAPIPNRQAREELDAAYINVFDRIRHINTEELTASQIGLIADLNIVYVSWKMEFSKTPREFNLQYTSDALDWTLRQRENMIFKIAPERLVCVLLFRGIIGGMFATRDASAVLADFDEALHITNTVGRIETDFLLKADIHRFRAYALVRMGDFNEAEASELESLKLMSQHTDSRFIFSEKFREQSSKLPTR